MSIIERMNALADPASSDQTSPSVAAFVHDAYSNGMKTAINDYPTQAAELAASTAAAAAFVYFGGFRRVASIITRDGGEQAGEAATQKLAGGLPINAPNLEKVVGKTLEEPASLHLPGDATGALEKRPGAALAEAFGLPQNPSREERLAHIRDLEQIEAKFAELEERVANLTEFGPKTSTGVMDGHGAYTIRELGDPAAREFTLHPPKLDHEGVVPDFYSGRHEYFRGVPDIAKNAEPDLF